MDVISSLVFVLTVSLFITIDSWTLFLFAYRNLIRHTGLLGTALLAQALVPTLLIP
jgi:hypothetical protein